VPTAAVKFALMSPDVHLCHGDCRHVLRRSNYTQSGGADRGHPPGPRRRSARQRRCRRRQGLDNRGPMASDSMIGAKPFGPRDAGCQRPSLWRCAFVNSGFPVEQHDRLILRLFHGAARSPTGLRPRVAYWRSLPVCSEMPFSAPWAAVSSERPRSASATNPTSRLLWSMTGSRLT
jgi:hypothetical protein